MGVGFEQPALETLLDLYRRDRALAMRLSRAIYQFAETGRGDVKKIAGSEHLYRLRVGGWRVIFGRGGTDVWVTEIVNRRDAYR